MSGARAPAAVLGLLVALVLLAVQLLADGLYGRLAVAGSLPHRLAGDWPFAVSARTGLDRLPFVRLALARGAVVLHEPQRALALLAPLGQSPNVLDVRGHAEALADDEAAALHDFIAAGDFVSAQAAIDPIAARDPRAALNLVHEFEQRLDAAAAAPEITAEVEWREGVIAAAAAARYPAERSRYEYASLDAFARALGRAPNEEKYLLNYAFAALRIGDAEGARRTYERAAEVVPNSVDAFVGIAATKALLGDCAGASVAQARATAFAQAQGRVADASRDGYANDVLTALRRCVR